MPIGETKNQKRRKTDNPGLKIINKLYEGFEELSQEFSESL